MIPRGADPDHVVIGSRRSRLARIQTRRVGALLLARRPGIRIEYRTLDTAGDRDRTTPLPEIGGKGVFTRDLEAALEGGELDLVVHSLKDLPTETDGAPTVVAIPERHDPRDVFIVRPDLLDGVSGLEDLPPHLRIGTSSTRRAAQTRRGLREPEIEPLRGNVETRLARVEAGDLDGVVLAAAGLDRLELRPAGAMRLDLASWPGAPGQGALAVQWRQGDERARELAEMIHDPVVAAAVGAERALLGRLGGGCSLPVGAVATHHGPRLRLVAAVYPPDPCDPVIEGSAEAPPNEADRLGISLAERLLDAGASGFL